MTRGRIPVRALERSEPIAKKRGLVQRYIREPGVICNFEILGPGIVAKVALRCVRRLGGTVKEIERDLAAVIAEIRIIASSREISRELWLCSPRYAYRFFRVLDTGLIELGCDGAPLPAAAPGAGNPATVTTSGSGSAPAANPPGTGTPGSVGPGGIPSA